MNSLKSRLALALAVALSLAAGVLWYGGMPEPAAAQAFQVHPLVGVPPADVGRYAVDYTRAAYQVVSGTPEVVLVRPVTAAELPSLGFAKITFGGSEPPLALVVLRGDFDISAMHPRSNPATWHSRVGYVAYVFDVKVGAPTLTSGSHRGGALRAVLNDPTLPDDAPVVPPNLSGQPATAHPAAPPPAKLLQPGEVAPPVAPPSGR